MENNTPKSYSIAPGNGYVTLKLIGECEHGSIRQVEEELKLALSDNFPHLIVNCEHLTHLPKDWIRFLLQTKSSLAKQNKEIRFILMKPLLFTYLKREGVDAGFPTSPSLREALVEFKLVSKKALDTDFINPFLTATLHVLEVQANVKATQGKIQVKKPTDRVVGDISGVIGLVSEAFSGSVVISFPEKTFLKVMSGMLGEEYTEVTKDILDGAGEITNMIFGQAKVVLNEKGYGIKTAIPSVIAGKDHSHTALTSGPTIVVPFESNAGEFNFEICLSA